MLGIRSVYASPISLGRGFTRSAHGVIPVPVPATVELLKGIPVNQTDLDSELTTPTGAAIVSTVAEGFGPNPMTSFTTIGYGAGSRDLAQRPNLLRVFSGEIADELLSDTVTLIEANIDDANPEVLAYAMSKLFDDGALDVFFTPIYMKKNRPATRLTVISSRGREASLSRVVLRETSTIGVRMVDARRIKLPREEMALQTPIGEIRVKVARMDGEVKCAPEYESCRELADETGMPIGRIYQMALTAAQEQVIGTL
jgi:uncharacterized protein (TIGR00299 family) protein